MSYAKEGILTTDSRQIAVSETWDTDTDWLAYQSNRFLSVSNGEVTLQDNVSENYEHNDLAGVYTGDTSAFSIQTGTVFEGTYALQGSDVGSHNIITRTTQASAFDRFGLEITWRQYQMADGNGGLALMTSQQGVSGNYGFAFQMRDDLDNISISKITSGSTALADSTSGAPATGQWATCSLVMNSDGTITFTADGTTVSITDSDYQNVYLGAHTFSGPDFIDDVQVGLIEI